MSEAATPNADETGKRLQMAIDYVRDCERRVSKGEIMDLQGLDDNVVEICDAVAALPKKEAEELEDSMSTLIEGLEALARAMKDQQDRYIAAEGGGEGEE